MHVRRAAGTLALLAALAAEPAGAQDSAPEVYRACIAQIGSDAAGALARAREWEQEGGGNPARYCAANALATLGDFAGAAVVFGDLGSEMAGPNPVAAARMYAEQSRALLLDERPDEALAAIDRALGLAPAEPSFFLDRAYINGAAGDFAAALADLDQALAHGPETAEIRVLRAAANRQEGNLAAALEEAERAVFLAPGAPDTFLERGNVRRAMGDIDGARYNWSQVLRIAPDSPAADAARINLDRNEAPDAGAGG